MKISTLLCRVVWLIIVILSLQNVHAQNELKKYVSSDSVSYTIKQGSTDFILTDTEVITMTSGIVKRDYRLVISVPYVYFVAGNEDQNFPVIYLIDAQWYHPILHSTYGTLRFDNLMPHAILVGITWGNGPKDVDRMRMQDLMPKGGITDKYPLGARKFHDVLTTEIMPFIESAYRTEDHTTLIGSSAGGFFALYTALTKPDMFDHYIAIGPKPLPQKKMLDAITYFQSQPAPESPASLYLVKGEIDTLPEFENLVPSLLDLPSTKIDVNYEISKKAGHASSNLAGFSYGISSVFQDYYTK